MVLDTALQRMFVVLIAGGVPAVASAQNVVPVQEEPHHRLVLEDSLLRVLDVRIAPGDTTGFHLHAAPIAFVSISPASVDAQPLGGRWATASGDTSPRVPIGTVRWNETYADAPLAHRVTNTDDQLFRLIAVVHRGSGDPNADGGELGSAGPAEAEGRWFRSAHRTIRRGAALAWAAYRRPVVAVLVSDGKLTISSTDGTADQREGIGAFVVLAAGEALTLRSRSRDGVTLAFVELR